MERSRLISAFVAALYMAGASSAQSISQDSHAARNAILDVFPNAHVRIDPLSGSLVRLSGVRVTGMEGSTEQVAAQFLEKLVPLIEPNASGVEYVAISRRETRAGGVRLLMTSSDGPTTSAYIVGVNREKDGDRYYVDSSGLVAPPGYVFVRSTEVVDFEEVRSDWYVYFVFKTDTEEGRAVALRSVDDAPLADLTGVVTPPLLARTDSRMRDGDDSAFTTSDVCSSGDFSFSATGNVYMTNPLLAEPVPVPLPNLCNQAPLILEGRLVHVHPESGSDAFASDGLFDFGPGEDGFDDVAVYYHVDRFLTMMSDLGFPVTNPQVSVETRSSRTQTAFSFGFGNYLVFGVPSGPYQDAAREAAIIAHETTHLLLSKVSSSLFGVGEKENWAMGEAYPDYFGLYYRSAQSGHRQPWLRPVVGMYVALQMSRDLPRDLSDPLPNYVGYSKVNYVGTADGPSALNKYDNSVIFSAALLDYDRDDASESSVSFVIESLFNLPDSPYFINGRDALMIAASDCAVSGEPDTYECCEHHACNTSVAKAFASRGIGEPDEGVHIDAEIANSDYRPTTSTLVLDGAYPNPFSDAVHVRFDLLQTEFVSLNVYDASGRLISQLVNRTMAPGTNTVMWKPEGLPVGAYFYEITAGATVKRGSLIYVR